MTVKRGLQLRKNDYCSIAVILYLQFVLYLQLIDTSKAKSFSDLPDLNFKW